MKKAVLFLLFGFILSGCATSITYQCIEGNCQNGQGTYTFASGEKYVGEFKDNKYHGQGTLTLANGDTCSGRFENDKCLGETIRFAEKKEPKEQQPKKQLPDNDKIIAEASGTGFFVSKSGHIITNNHVIDGCDIVKTSFDGKQINSKVLSVDKVNDLAILKTDITPNYVYSVSDEDVELLENIIIAGYPLGKQVSAAIKTSKGSVTALAGNQDNFFIVKFI